MVASTLDWKIEQQLSFTMDRQQTKDVSHIGIRSRRVRRTDTSIDKPIVVVVQSWDIHSENLLDMVGKTDFFDFDARLVCKFLYQ